MDPITISIAKHTEPGIGVLAGQDLGKEIREKYRLDAIDAMKGEEVPTGAITVEIPESVYSFNSSFFLGLLSRSVVALGAEEFRRRFRFVGPDADQTREKGIQVSMLTAAPIRTFRRKTA